MNLEVAQGQQAFQEALREQFYRRRSKNPAFSLRAFARFLKLSPAALSEILNGKRNVSRRIAQKIAVQLGVDPQEADRMMRLAVRKKRTLKPKRTESSDSDSVHYQVLKADEFKIVSQWQHFALLSLAETRGFKSDVQWIAKRLSIDPATVRLVIDRLVRLGLLSRDPKTRTLKITGRPLSTTDGVADTSIRMSHLENLELAQKSLERDRVEERDFTSLTLAIDPKHLTEARKMIRLFRDRISKCLETGSRSSVYRFSTQLYPLTREEREL